jgi:hypothetical protein
LTRWLSGFPEQHRIEPENCGTFSAAREGPRMSVKASNLLKLLSNPFLSENTHSVCWLLLKKIKIIGPQPTVCELNKAFTSKELKPFMLDPSVLTSDVHLQAVLKSGLKFKVPSTFLILIDKNPDRVPEVLRYFIPSNISPILSRYVSVCRERGIVEGYGVNKKRADALSRAQRERNLPTFASLYLPTEVQQILLEEYSFMKEESSLLSRFREPLQLFRRVGFVIVDAYVGILGVLVSSKQYAWFSPLKWYVAQLLKSGVSDVAEQVMKIPNLSFALSEAAEIMLLFDS